MTASRYRIMFGICSLLLILFAAGSAELRVDSVNTRSLEDEPRVPVFPAQVTCTRYVATTGSDSHAGTEAQPWATFQHAADSAQPGDTICFRGGTYSVEAIHVTASGTPTAPITFIAFPGETPVVSGGAETGDLLILDKGASYLRLSGFHLRNFGIWGIYLEGENRHVKLDHLDIEGGEAAVRFTCCEVEQPAYDGPVEHITVEDSKIRGSLYSALDCTPGPCNYMEVRRLEISETGLTGEDSFGSDGLEFARGYPVLVEDCYIHDNGGDGIDLNSRDRAGNASGVIVRRNRVGNNHRNGIKLWAGGRIENNVVWGQGDSPMWCGTFTSTLEVYNNTLAYNMWDPAYSGRNWSFVAGYPEYPDENPMAMPVTLTLVNNIFAFNADPLDGGATGIYLGAGVNLVDEEHNLFYSNEEEEITAEFVAGHDAGFTRAEIANGTWNGVVAQGQNDRTVDPRFVTGWPNVDLHLQQNSDAVDAGRGSGAPTDDAEGSARDATPDLGAYEFGATKQGQTITFAVLESKTVDAAPFGIEDKASASSGLPVSFTAAGVCTVSGSTVTLTGQPGSCTITAHQGGNETYGSAAPVSRSFNVIAQANNLFLPTILRRSS